MRRADLQRGQDRYTIYCTPCHGQLGDGQGMVVQRGLRQAATYHQDRLRADRARLLLRRDHQRLRRHAGLRRAVPPRDRWLIAAYVRALQLSQNATIDDVPAADRGRLDAPRRAGAGAADGAARNRRRRRNTRHGAETYNPPESLSGLQTKGMMRPSSAPCSPASASP